MLVQRGLVYKPTPLEYSSGGWLAQVDLSLPFCVMLSYEFATSYHCSIKPSHRFLHHCVKLS